MRTAYFALIAMIVLMVAQTAKTGAPDDEDVQQSIRNSNAMLHSAVGALDVRLVAALLFAEHDPDFRLVESQARRIVASVRLQTAIQKNFAQRDSGRLAEPFRIVPGADFMSLLLVDHWKIKGDKAFGSVPDLEREGQMIPPMRNVGGVWKVDISPPSALPPDDMKVLIESIDKQAQIIESAAGGITSGKLRTMQEVRQAANDLPHFTPETHTPDIVLDLPRK